MHPYGHRSKRAELRPDLEKNFFTEEMVHERDHFAVTFIENLKYHGSTSSSSQLVEINRFT